jgi:hypothetical protein
MSLENVNAMTILSEGPVEADPISVDAYYIDLAIAAQVLLVKDSVSDNWRLVVAIRKPKVNLLNPRVRHCEFKKRSFNGRSCRPLTPLRRTPIQ